jgi:tetratricopeptide (TPR) repeat protein
MRGRAARAVWLALAALFLCSPLVARSADEAPVDLEELEKARAKRAALYPVRARISRYLEAAAKAVDKDEPKEAQRLLEKLDPKRLNPYERALVYRLRAYVAYSETDFLAAIENFDKVLAEEVLPPRDDNRIRFNIAQLYASLQKWPEAIAALDRWERYASEPDPLAHYLRGIAYYQIDDLEKALSEAEKAVDLSPEPPEGWLQLLAALYTQKEDYAGVTPILEELVVRFPKKQYWVQLSLIYGAREDYKHSLAVQQVAYLQGFLTEDKELRRLARSYLYANLPHPAAQVLEKGLADGSIPHDAEALELLANSWVAAREYERAVPPLREAAQRSADGNLYVRLAQVYLQNEQWKEATEALQRGIQKGGLKNPGNAELLLGIAYYNDARVEQARSSFVRARQYDSTRDAAEQWMTHLDREAGETGPAEASG